jgi:vacuolar-type H+-ATPase subunit F/Vma7
MSPAGNIFAIGERERVRAFALAGVQVVPADDPEAARAAWEALPAGFGLVILTSAAHDAVAPSEQDERLWVVIPE